MERVIIEVVGVWAEVGVFALSRKVRQSFEGVVPNGDVDVQSERAVYASHSCEKGSAAETSVQLVIVEIASWFAEACDMKLSRRCVRSNRRLLVSELGISQDRVLVFQIRDDGTPIFRRYLARQVCGSSYCRCVEKEKNDVMVRLLAELQQVFAQGYALPVRSFEILVLPLSCASIVCPWFQGIRLFFFFVFAVARR